ncbi:MAG: 5-(carboxyamino)imidazole ribonucleotide mutase [Clostridiales bacterium]|jgi:5-(carboxyamino)imidazole ribonucleotide mutase|nr:5-(carboxyamino)imidazole ribonucleotide mutase [Clostridiales bacterium]
MKKILIVLGSDSDLNVMRAATEVLARFGVLYELRIASAHRTPALAHELSSTAREKGFGAIIAAAGKAAHLAGVLASCTTLPVIGVPINASTLDGLDALLSTVQMPKGIPVATVAIDGADNAALLAVEMLAIHDDELAEKLSEYKKEMENAVIAKDLAAREGKL